tara:strand:+ start:116 stop:559 length:444 start_codon:yes stop_codon:yes gene_type:complete
MVDSIDIIEIVKLYRKFSKYDSYTDREIAKAIIPSLSLNQYKIFEDEYGDIYAFTNWAYLSKKVEEKFLKTGILENVDWQSGNICWHIETINTTPNKLKEIYKYTATRLKKDIGENNFINWIRINNSGKEIKRINKMKVSTAIRKFN